MQKQIIVPNEGLYEAVHLPGTSQQKDYQWNQAKLNRIAREHGGRYIHAVVAKDNQAEITIATVSSTDFCLVVREGNPIICLLDDDGYAAPIDEFSHLNYQSRKDSPTVAMWREELIIEMARPFKHRGFTGKPCFAPDHNFMVYPETEEAARCFENMMSALKRN